MTRQPVVLHHQTRYATTTESLVGRSLVAGSLSGMLSTLICFPLDVIRTKMQQTVSSRMASTVSATAERTISSRSGPLQVVFHTVQHGGVRALYTGLALPLGAQCFYKATLFTVNNVCLNLILKFKTEERRKAGLEGPYKLTLGDHMIGGFFGGLVNGGIFVTPVEFIRNQMIGNHTRRSNGIKVDEIFKGPLDVVRSTVRTKGILGLWRGLGITLARDSLGCSAYFLAMNACQRSLTSNRKPGERPPLAVAFLSGACSGLAYWFTALPMDTIKTWVQDGSEESARKALQRSIQQRGVTATVALLFRGWQVAFGRGLPSSAITIFSYEFWYRQLEDNF